MTITNKVFLLLGGNIAPRFEFLKNAESKITEFIGEIVLRSSIYETEAVGFVTSKLFLNMVLLINSTLSANEILIKIHEIESELGRVRVGTGYVSRTIDIDILYFNDLIINTKNLIIPHPRLAQRRFTLLPLVEIAPDFINPVYRQTNKKLLDICTDYSDVKRLSS